MSYRLGASAKRDDFDKLMPWKFKTTTSSGLMRDWFDKSKNNEQTLHRLEDHMEQRLPSPRGMFKSATTLPSDEADYRLADSKKPRKQTQRQMTPVPFLKQVPAFLPSALPDMTIDYITPVRTCNSLMRTLKSDLARRLGVQYPATPGGEGDSNDHGVVFMVMDLLDGANEACKQQTWGPNEKEPFRGDDGMKCAGKTMVKFWSKHGVRTEPAPKSRRDQAERNF